MQDLLFLTPRIPYPPNRGDKLRAWNVLLHLRQYYRIHLACFVDAPEDWEHVPFVKSMCASSFFAPLDQKRKLWRAGLSLLKGKPVSVEYHYARAYEAWVQQTLANVQPSAAYFFSSELADYVPAVKECGATILLDFVDMDSAKWKEYGVVRKWPMSMIFRREAGLLHAIEVDLANQADHSFFVSADETKLFNESLPEGITAAEALPNGVDLDYFASEVELESPYEAHEQAMVFTGVMNYWPNVDAVHWFADEVFPTIMAAVPNARFYIVGMRPTPEVEDLGKRDGIVVTGAVPDVRPYVAHATTAVAPLRVARGVQNKVIEAMAMAKPVLATPQAAEGLGDMSEDELVVIEDPALLAQHAIGLLKGDIGTPSGVAARAKVEQAFSWSGQLSRLNQLLTL
jgi:sugar transferase (PEP-CTERM/EpsH1 system associated)